jgi:predicted nucleotidyltransferase
MTKEEIKKIIREHKEILKKYKVKSIALFGSYVRNEQKEDSDIDLLVEFKENTYRNFINLIFSLEDLFKKEVTVVSREDLSPHIKPYVLKEIEKIEGR